MNISIKRFQKVHGLSYSVRMLEVSYNNSTSHTGETKEMNETLSESRNII